MTRLQTIIIAALLALGCAGCASNYLTPPGGVSLAGVDDCAAGFGNL